jgi:hypothetical protein
MFKVPRHRHQRQTEMFHHTVCVGGQGTVAPLQPQQAEEIWLVTQNPD